MMRSIYDISLKDLEAYLLDNGMKPFHAKQIFRWLYCILVHSVVVFINISKTVMTTLTEDYTIETKN